MLQQTINNLLHDVSIVQRYIQNGQDAGFNDMTRLLESLSIHLIGASHDLDLINKNLLAPNFPAIDLADDKRRTAVQVTANADAAKIRHTLKKFDEHKLAKEYDNLIIHGFVNCSKGSRLPRHCSVLSIGQIVSRVADKNDEELAQKLVDAIQQHVDFSRIHPYDDRNCLKIVLHCVDRNAVKHQMPVEGSYREMIKGLNEITELISKGTINRKSKGKSVDSFQDPDIMEYLVRVRDKIGRIVAIVNKSREGSDFVGLPWEQRHEIDRLKIDIIILSSEIAAAKNIRFSIGPIFD